MTELLTGVDANYRTPDIMMEVGFAQGATAGVAPKRIPVLAMPKTSDGTYPINVIQWPANEAAVIAGCGKNSVIHRAWKFWKRIFPGGAVGLLPYAESAGGTAASTTVTVSGTATAQTDWTLGIGDVDVTVIIDIGDTADDIASKMRAKASASDTTCLVTGTNASVILTYIILGLCGGTASYKGVKLRTSAPGAGITIMLPGDLGASSPGTDGATTEAMNLQAALNANSGIRMYNIVSHLGGQSTALSVLASYLSNQALPRAGYRETAIVGYNAPVSAGTVLAVGQNYPRLNFVNGIGYKNTPEQIAVQIAALFSKYESSDPTMSFSLYSEPDFLLTPLEDSTKWLDKESRNDAILGGQTVFGVNEFGRGFVNKAVTTRVRDSSGQYADFRAYERHRVSGADDTADLVQADVALFLKGKKLVDDPMMPDGKTIDWNKVAKLPRGVTCPIKVQGVVRSRLEERVSVGQAQRLDEMLASLKVGRSRENQGRVNISYDYFTPDLADQAAIYEAEATRG